MVRSNLNKANLSPAEAGARLNFLCAKCTELFKKIPYSEENYYSCCVDRVRSVGLGWLDKLAMRLKPVQLGYLLPA